jgi:hypothetical protein
MGPKKREPQRHDQTIADVLKLPLEAQHGNLKALLIRPTPLSDGELSQVAQHISLLLLRATDAITQGEHETFGFLIELLSRSLLSAEAMRHATCSFVESCDVPSKLGDITTLLSKLLPRSEWRDHAPKYMLMLEPICTSATLKELVASYIMEPLLLLLQRNGELDPDGEDYRLPREVTARLIDLVRSSSKNKILPKSWRVIVTQLLQSNDMFHQLQCVELLFRITRQPKVVPPAEHPLLRAKDFTGAGGLPIPLAERIRDMPADSKMLSAARDACHHVRTYQMSRRAQNRVQQAFRSLRVTFAGHTISAAASEISFGPHYFVAMISSETAENVTVAYSDVASVRTGRDGSLTLRLLRTPEDILVLPDIPTVDGGQLIVFLPPSELQQFKDGPIISWFKQAREKATTTQGVKRDREEPHASTKASGAGQLLEPVVLFPQEQRQDARPQSAVLRTVVEKQLRQFLDKQRDERQTFVTGVIQEDLDRVQHKLSTVRSEFQQKISDASSLMLERVQAITQQVEAALPELTRRVELDSAAIEPFKASLAESNSVIAFANSELCDRIEQSRHSDKEFLKEINSDFQRRIATLHDRHMMESIRSL